MSEKTFTIVCTIDGERLTLTLPQILEIINADRSDDWTPYDESDWREGLENFTSYKVIQ